LEIKKISKNSLKYLSFSLVIIFLVNNFIFAALSQTEISEKVKLEEQINQLWSKIIEKAKWEK